jgi:predicted permease
MHIFLYITFVVFAVLLLVLSFIASGIYTRVAFATVSAVLFAALALMSGNIELASTVVSQTVFNAATNATQYTYEMVSSNVENQYIAYVMIMLLFISVFNVWAQLSDAWGANK